ncbi:MAG: hypothetical protein HYX69_17470 [Planctomycetia bacterium]|nr:hypothetical protein [Planctomycetia bacterium]
MSKQKNLARPRKQARTTRAAAKTAAVKRGKRPASRGRPTVHGASHAASRAVRHPASRAGAGPTLPSLKDRLAEADLRGDPTLSSAESNAVHSVATTAGLLDHIREQAFVELAGVVERELARHGHRLSRREAANVAWEILSARAESQAT